MSGVRSDLGMGDTTATGVPRATLTAEALRTLAAKDPALAESLGMSPKKRAPKSISRRGIVHHKESGSPFDQTRCAGPLVRAPGVLEGETRGAGEAPREAAPGETLRPDPKAFLLGHSGFGGNNTTAIATRVGDEGRGAAGGSPLRGGAAKRSPARAPRSNPPNTALRIFYERGHLPAVVDFRSAKPRIHWKTPIEALNLEVLLPVFFDGLREEEQPFQFLAEQGATEILQHVGLRVGDIVSTLVMPLRTCLCTRRRRVMTRTLRMVQRLVTCDLDEDGKGRVGRELVPFYRQLLPVLNVYVHDNRNLGDGMDYGQKRNECPGDLIQDTLQLLEATGGEVAAVNIQYYIPTYEAIGGADGTSTALGEIAVAASAKAAYERVTAGLYGDEEGAESPEPGSTAHSGAGAAARRSPSPAKAAAKKGPPATAPADPVDDAPAADTPADDTPSADAPAADTPPVDASPADAPAADDTAAPEPAPEEEEAPPAEPAAEGETGDAAEAAAAEGEEAAAEPDSSAPADDGTPAAEDTA